MSTTKIRILYPKRKIEDGKLTLLEIKNIEQRMHTLVERSKKNKRVKRAVSRH